ncbi:amino acid ABC transporter ATP-binding protein [Gordonia sp. VNQ95]|uniref:amino acid ABC transporter ATP-binding protein n=1 Tax=Gordonia TaxID=2053 RepID=UPI0032B511D1
MNAASGVGIDAADLAGVTGAGARVEVRNAHRWYGNLHVLKGIDLTVEPGRVAAILGPSGSGKSTLLRTINHLDRLDAGHVSIGGELIGVRRVGGGRLKELPERVILRQRRDVGFVFQNFNLFANLTALDNVAAAPTASGVLSRAAAVARARDLLDRVGLSDKADAYPRQLSGGQQQRVAIARALALEPRVLLFDEPTSALDPELVGDVLSVIADLAATGTTMLIVTHEIGFARQVADSVIFIDHGEIIEQGTPDQVLDHPSHPRTQDFLRRVL